VNCEKITYYIEKGYLTDLKLSEKLQIKLHTMICNCCKNYAPDSNVVNHVLTLLKEEDTSQYLTDEEKQSLKDALQKLGEA
tara:strand:- start:9449 stop:9691 length:243 start_codon:yes stop_codon:yes gene_type:complete